jgi:hypothetical protein
MESKVSSHESWIIFLVMSLSVTVSKCVEAHLQFVFFQVTRLVTLKWS